MNKPKVLKQGEVTAYLKSAKRAGYASATVEATVQPDGTKTVKVTAHEAEEITKPNGNGSHEHEMQEIKL